MAVVALARAGNGLAQGNRAGGRCIGRLAIQRRAVRRLDHIRRRWKIGFAGPERDNVAAGAFHRGRSLGNLQYLGKLDRFHPGGRAKGIRGMHRWPLAFDMHKARNTDEK